jgi:hypothetical protein
VQIAERHALGVSDERISGETFAAICETFADLPEMDAAREATGLLARWLEDGIIARIVGAA